MQTPKQMLSNEFGEYAAEDDCPICQALLKLTNPDLEANKRAIEQRQRKAADCYRCGQTPGQSYVSEADGHIRHHGCMSVVLAPVRQAGKASIEALGLITLLIALALVAYGAGLYQGSHAQAATVKELRENFAACSDQLRDLPCDTDSDCENGR